MLEEWQAVVVRTESGQQALETLQQQPDVDLILMDIMMPGMDGYQTMRAIRKQQRFQSLPIIALTAKAMKGDREKCLEAGASDYLAKPVNSQQLRATLRTWLTGQPTPEVATAT
jgi:CheY-like chemotaxis protein